MYKTTVAVKDMACAMCEAHIKEAIRREFEGENRLKKVSANSIKGFAEIVSEQPIDARRLQATIERTGYTPGEASSCQVEKSLFGYRTVK
jgi:copper chaperone CopZ